MSKHSHKTGNTGEMKDNHPQTGVPGSATPPDGQNPNAAQDASRSSEQQAEAGMGQGNAAPETPAGKIAALEAELVSQGQKTAEFEAKLTELNDQYLRKAADFENFRKRTIREKQELTEFANQSLLLDLLPIIDDFERAIKSAQSSPAAQTSKDFASFYEGIFMIEKQLSSQLESKWGLKRFDSGGEPFDPNRHEAIQMEKKAGVSEAVVGEDYLKGYLLKDKVIRFAKVKVLMPETSAGEAEADK